MKNLYQLFDVFSSTYTYLLVEEITSEAVMIDPVDTHLDEYLTLLDQENLKLKVVIETHTHADHITSAGVLCKETGAAAATSLHCNITPAEIQLVDGQEIQFGKSQRIKSIYTPGHTSGAMCFLWAGKLFTGDTLLINGCGRTDFQSGDAGLLYDSITQKLFNLPDDTMVYPGHDYNGKTVSTIGFERNNNARIVNKSRDQFIDLMSHLDLAKPAMINEAVLANQSLGLKSK